MNIIKTKSFELAILSRGDCSAPKLAILIPGRLDTKDYINFVSHAEYLTGNGFLAVAFDPPGVWGSPGGIELYTTTNYIKAINELIEYFGDKPTLLLGHSRGAAAAILASSNINVIGVVSVMANFGAPTVPSGEAQGKGFEITRRDLPPGGTPTKERKEFTLPIAYWDDGKKYNTIETLKKCIKPKLIVCGTTDQFTTPDEVKNLYKMIPEPKMIKEINCNHDYRYYLGAIQEVEEALGQFLYRYKL
ncbi:alpha/beta hydrolase [Candidatus Kuenenbacteria bacterium]|nr:alpha/beta hydrolase [Candidatus Kuenenbacteria bacterium]